MASNSLVDLIRASRLFDAEWYAAQYLDVGILGMEAARHYQLYGSALGRDPGPELSTVFTRIAYGMKPDQEPITSLARMEQAKGEAPLPNPKRILLAAHEVARRGDPARGIALAERHLPSELRYTASILRANAAIGRRDEAGWQRHLNAYLDHFGTAPIRLQGSGTVFDRLATDPLPAVTGGPLVSVIMPAWNAEATVAKAAQSILDQTWRNLELLIVDDASTDGTWPVLQRLAATDDRVKIARNKVNVGPYVSKNIALSQARGEWITGHDADDWAHPQRLESHVTEVLSRPTPLRASHTYMARFTPDGAFNTFSGIGGFSPDGVTRVSSISTLFRAEFLKQQLGFWDSVRFGGDSEMISRARLLLGDEFSGLLQLGMLCLSSETSLTNHPEFGIALAGNGLSRTRADYKAAWTAAHSQLTREDLYMPFPITRSPYAIHESHAVPMSAVNANLTGQGVPGTDASLARHRQIRPMQVPPHLKFVPKKVAFVVFEHLVVKFLEKGDEVVFDEAFFASKIWPARANSTSRLTLVNYEAIRRLQRESGNGPEIVVVSGNDWSPAATLASDFDTIVVNQIASLQSHKWLQSFVDLCRSAETHKTKNIIFGTEVSFEAELRKQTFTPDQVDYIYRSCLLLRHTARTDKSVYRNGDALKTQILEFEIGLDHETIRYGLPPAQRRFITFVAAPEGRVTKDNGFIDLMVSRIAASPLREQFEVRVLRPPYSTADYWELMRNTAFFIFTSNGETFSYVLNDAKACGAIALFKEHLYYTAVGAAFAVSHYPELSFRYQDADDALGLMVQIAGAPERMDALSRQSRTEAVCLFGLDRIHANWKRLLRGEAFPTQKLLLLAPEIEIDVETITNLCNTHGARFAMSLYNIVDVARKPVLTYQLKSDIIWLHHFITRSDGCDRYSLSRDVEDNPRYTRLGKDYTPNHELEVGFYELVRRSYHIGEVVFVTSQDTSLPAALVRVIETRGMGLSVLIIPQQ